MRRDPYFSVIRDKCLDCSHAASEVSWCTATSCALRLYRMGTNPLRAAKIGAKAAVEQGKRLAASRKAATEDPAAWLGLSVVLITPSAGRQPGTNVAWVVAFVCTLQPN